MLGASEARTCTVIQAGDSAVGRTGSDSLLIDATWIPCGDSTESLYIYSDGSAVYAHSNSGVCFEVGDANRTVLTEIVAQLRSHTDTAGLDSCTTIGLVLSGPRYLLVNSENPLEKHRTLVKRLETLRRYGRRRMEREVERTLHHMREGPNKEIMSDPSLDPQTLLTSLYESPIVATWRCRGTVTVTAQIDSRGNVRRAFVADADVEGKCSALLVMTALRAVWLASFDPAEKEGGAASSAWMNVVVRFGHRGVTPHPESISNPDS
jgi:hypothetical protein